MASFFSDSAPPGRYPALVQSEALDDVPEEEEIRGLIADAQQHLIAPPDSEGGDDFVFG